MEPEAAWTPPDGALRARARVVVGLASAWLWTLALALPALELGAGGWARAALALVFPAVVAAGLVLDVLAPNHVSHVPTSTRRRGLGDRATELALLVLAPAALAGALASRAELTSREVMGPAHLVLLVLAAGSYLAAAAWLSSARAPRRSGRPQALPPTALSADRGWARAMRLSLLGLAWLASVALVAIAPTWTGHASRVARYGPEGADTAALLATVVGLALSVGLLGGVVAPAMRAPASAPSPPRPRTAVWLGLALVGAAAWWLLDHA